jgi:acyl dehydratase
MIEKMTNQPLYRDIEEGSEIPTLIKHPTTKSSVKWSGATEDYYEIHYDKDFARSRGLPGVIVHGGEILSFLGQMITDWMGEQGTVKVLGCDYRGVFFPGEDVICKGKITKKYIKDENYLECEIWAENPRGEKLARGKAVVTLPD